MEIKFQRDPQKEKWATDKTKQVRGMLDGAGIEWGIGIYPNIETDYVAGSSIGPMAVNVVNLPDGKTSIAMYNMNQDLTDEQINEAIRQGISVGMPILKV